MFRQKILSLTSAALSAAALLVNSGPASAQHHGGGHGSGYHGGGYHGGYGGYHGGYYGGYRGGYYGGHEGYHRGYYGFSLGYSPLWYGGYYPRYYYPRYYGYASAYYPDYYTATSPAPLYQSFYAPPAPALEPSYSSNNRTQVNVWVPSDAEVWFNGAATSQTGTFRQFVSPPLTPGQNFSYEVRARWIQDGQPIEQVRKVLVHAGEQVNVDFMHPTEQGS